MDNASFYFSGMQLKGQILQNVFKLINICIWLKLADHRCTFNEIFYFAIQLLTQRFIVIYINKMYDVQSTTRVYANSRLQYKGTYANT